MVWTQYYCHMPSSEWEKLAAVWQLTNLAAQNIYRYPIVRHIPDCWKPDYCSIPLVLIKSFNICIQEYFRFISTIIKLLDQYKSLLFITEGENLREEDVIQKNFNFNCVLAFFFAIPQQLSSHFLCHEVHSFAVLLNCNSRRQFKRRGNETFYI